MNTIEDYAQRLLGIMAGSRNDARAAARTARDLTRNALANDRFVIACVERVVASIESSPSAWPNPPLYTADDPGVSVRLIF